MSFGSWSWDYHTTAENASIANDISVTDMLVSGNNRKVVLTSSNIVTINSV